MAFTEEEITYLRAQPLARLATVDPDGQPDVVPVAIEFENPGLWICGAGEQVLRTRKVRNVLAGNRKVSLVVDDLVSIDPFVARGIRIYGTAGDPVERIGMVGPGFYLPVSPTVSWSWNLAGEPAGQEWYETKKTVHRG
ncbi:PPOX class F420-dependent oxidoreductase [Nocardia amikacinitolerans]|uniref:PPOX class F420-dependent oxidoreductase n=1 Tax=Nocardia amikacinitolerans TaxID=756689 RepID=UPI0020A40B3F|nr:PPOX class F420-dependent oxidoreductase [Nocardia amikacinitolerans]MCP2288187.1 pyridoxamine 5'-phosphate oxidase family protein [Nocardia amikacinitolerans]